jgi:molybdate transport system substrate-binding protein
MLRHLLYLALATALARPVIADEMFVSAAASLTDALKDLAARFEDQTGVRIVLNFAASALLARQIEENAPVDVFISADEAQMDRVQKQIAAETRTDLLTNKLVVIVRKDFALHLDNLGDLATPECRRIALANPKVVPAGVYAREVLTQAGLWEKLESKIVPTENVRATLAVVEAGNADAGFVYKTDAMTSHSVRLGLEVPPSLSPRIVYPVAILATSTHRDQAARFLAYLKSPEAVQVFERLGFGITK